MLIRRLLAVFLVSAFVVVFLAAMVWLPSEMRGDGSAAIIRRREPPAATPARGVSAIGHSP